MRIHIQGLFILLGVGVVFMVLAIIAAPIVGDAFGEDGAIVAEPAPEDLVDLASETTELSAPLNGEEVALLQANLTELGYDPGPVDGILGGGTRRAVDEAISEYDELSTGSSNREVLHYTQSLIEALAAAASDTSEDSPDETGEDELGEDSEAGDEQTSNEGEDPASESEASG